MSGTDRDVIAPVRRVEGWDEMESNDRLVVMLAMRRPPAGDCGDHWWLY